MMRKSRAELVVVAAAAVAAAAPIPPAVVEGWYSGRVYTAFQPVLTFASNAVPIALLDVLLTAITVAFLGLAVRDRVVRGAWVWRAVRRGIVWGAALYVSFLALWGLNYRRVPMRNRLAFDRGAVTSESASRLAGLVVDRLNALYRDAHAEGFGRASVIDPRLAGAFDRVARTLSHDRRVVAGRPKGSLLDWYFRRAGVSGMTDPYFLETLVASDLLPFERPFVIAHEWAHLAGLADEGEANLAGWLTCLQASAADQYSGWLFMYSEAIAAAGRDARHITARLEPGPREDLRAVRDRLARQVSPGVALAGWRVYDSYLKANRVEAGAESYDEVVTLALGLKIAQQALAGRP